MNNLKSEFITCGTEGTSNSQSEHTLENLPPIFEYGSQSQEILIETRGMYGLHSQEALEYISINATNLQPILHCMNEEVLIT